MDELERSDRPIVPVKPANKAGQPAAELVEGRGLAKGNPSAADVFRALYRSKCEVPARDGATRRTQRERRRHDGPTGVSFVPKAGAGCCSSARPDLWRGRPARAVPTPTLPRERSSRSLF